MVGESVDSILVQRGRHYGEFPELARVSQAIKYAMQSSRNWDRLQPYHREAIEAIVHKIARLLNGDPTHADSWRDISGYATLVVNELEQ